MDPLLVVYFCVTCTDHLERWQAGLPVFALGHLAYLAASHWLKTLIWNVESLPAENLSVLSHLVNLETCCIQIDDSRMLTGNEMKAI